MRRARLIDAYIANGQNATQAAKAVRLKVGTAQLIIRGETAQKEIKARLDELAAPFAIDAKRAVEILCKAALNDRRNFFNADGTLKKITELDYDTQLALDGFDEERRTEHDRKGGSSTTISTSKVKLGKRSTYLDMLFKHLGLYAKDNAQRGGDPDEIAAKVRERLAGIDESTGGK